MGRSEAAGGDKDNRRDVLRTPPKPGNTSKAVVILSAVGEHPLSH